MTSHSGSTENIDPLASDLSTGHSQVKSFNLSSRTDTYDFDTSGELLAWGVRNEVSITSRG